MNESSNNPIPPLFNLKKKYFFKPTLSRRIESLHRSISHLANLQNSIPIIPLFDFLPPDSPHINTSSDMDSDANSDITVFQFENTDLETPDEFADSKPSPSTFSQPSSSAFSQPPSEPSTPKPKVNPPLPLSCFPSDTNLFPFYK